jgi:hypothetical protein
MPTAYAHVGTPCASVPYLLHHTIFELDYGVYGAAPYHRPGWQNQLKIRISEVQH